MKLLAGIVALVVMFLGLGGVASATTAQTSGTQAVLFQIRAQHSDKCLDVRNDDGGLGNGAVVQQWTCLGISQANQLWRLVSV